jgi:hypothetical protein
MFVSDMACDDSAARWLNGIIEKKGGAVLSKSTKVEGKRTFISAYHNQSPLSLSSQIISYLGSGER